ncbi:MAG: restriction endonuclease [Bacilli bacterium]|nr:restriction endonuclease [Bacilli bacterium]
MNNKSKKNTIDNLIENTYYFLKEKLNFDDIQAITLMASIILIPVSVFFGFFNMKMEMFRTTLYITLGLDFLVVIYSTVKAKYFNNKRIFFARKLQNMTIEVKDMDDVNKLDPIAFEYFVKEMFVRKGYKAWTTKRTHDNGTDVIAEKGNERISIQVKHSSKPINDYAVYQTRRGKIISKANKAILVTNNELTNQAKLAANYDTIEFIDSHDISLFLRKNGTIKVTNNNH